MKKRNGLFGVLTLVLGLGVVGCGGKDVEAIVDKGRDKIKDVESMTTTTNFTMKMSMESGKNKLAMNADGKIVLDQNFKDEIAHQVETSTMDALGMKEDTKEETYVVADEDSYMKYTNSDDEWYGESTDEDDELLQLDTSIGDVSGADLKSAGTGKVDKEDTDKIEAELSKKELERAMAMASAMDSDMSSMFDELDLDEGMVVEVEYYQDSGLPASMEMDLTDLMKKAAEKSLGDSLGALGEDMSINVEEFTVRMEYTNYNDVDIKVPEDVKAVQGSGTIEGVENPKGPWDTFAFKYAGKDYQLPMTYADLQAMGFDFNEGEDPNQMIEPQDTGIVSFKDSEGKTMSITFKNPDGDNGVAKAMKDCNVIGLAIYTYGEEMYDIELPGGIKIGTTEEELNKLYPEFSDKYNAEDGDGTYTYYTEDFDSLRIDITDGLVSGVSYDFD